MGFPRPFFVYIDGSCIARLHCFYLLDGQPGLLRKIGLHGTDIPRVVDEKGHCKNMIVETSS